MLKETIQGLRGTNKSLLEEIHDKVRVYTVTPHSTTGMTPIKLIRARKPNCVFFPSLVNKRRGVAVRDNLNEVEWKSKVEEKMGKMKEEFHNRKKVEVTCAKVGGWAGLRLPVQSGASKFSKSMKVIKLFTNAVKTDDHKI